MALGPREVRTMVANCLQASTLRMMASSTPAGTKTREIEMTRRTSRRKSRPEERAGHQERPRPTEGSSLSLVSPFPGPVEARADIADSPLMCLYPSLSRLVSPPGLFMRILPAILRYCEGTLKGRLRVVCDPSPVRRQISSAGHAAKNAGTPRFSNSNKTQICRLARQLRCRATLDENPPLQQAYPSRSVRCLECCLECC